MSTIGTTDSRAFAITPAVGRVGHALVSWAERHEQNETQRRELHRRQSEAESSAAERSAAVWGRLMP